MHIIHPMLKCGYLLRILISLSTLLASITSSKALWIRLIATYWSLDLSLAAYTFPYAPLPTHLVTSYRSSTVIRPSLDWNYALPLILDVTGLTIFGSPLSINFWCYYCSFSSLPSFSFFSCLGVYGCYINYLFPAPYGFAFCERF